MKSVSISTLTSLFIGLSVTGIITTTSYFYIHRQSQNDYIKTDSKIFESLEVLQNRIDDLKMTSRSDQKPTAPIALIAIDDSSIEEIGRWPWSRVTLADLSEQVLNLGAKTLTYDLLLSEPERENPKADEILGQVIQKNSSRFILGTASRDAYPAQTHPFQDICTSEAFLYLGGDKIVTLNPTFTVDDQTENFDSYKWNDLFNEIFKTLSHQIENDFIKNLNLTSINQLNLYQKNALSSQKNKSIYNYCYSWLNQDDPFLQKEIFEQIKPFYESAFNQSLDRKRFEEIVLDIKKIKSHPIPQYLGWYANTAYIQNNSQYTAAFTPKMDLDGYIRRYPLFFRAGSKIGSSYIPSLAMQAYLISENYRAEVSLNESQDSSEKFIQSFKIYDTKNDKEPLYEVPIDSFAQLRLNYYGPERSFYYVPAKELLTKKSHTIEVQRRDKNKTTYETVNKNDFFKGKNVLVGATALGIFDLRNTPVQNAMPGPEIHLTALANLIEQNFIPLLPKAEVKVPLVTFILGIVFTLIWSFSSAISSIMWFIACSFILIFIDYTLLVKKNYLIPNWSIFAVFIFSFFAIALYKYFTEEKSKYKVRQAFSKYVSPAIVEELLKSEKNLALGGQKKTLTVLFSDLRGFTTFSEKLEPKQLSDFLNIYLTRMTAEVFKTKGTVDKFIGDAIMAFYGAPVSYDNHPHQACLCALNSIEELEKLNHELAGQNFPKLEMGIGINTGEMSVGNMGSSTIQNYTVMGDSVNLASRLEGLTRLYGNNIIIGPHTYEAVKSDFTCRELDRVIVKGKTNAISIYDLIYHGAVKPEDTKWLQYYQQGRQLYTQGVFSEALKIFERCLEEKPKDKVCLYYVSKCTQLIKNPPASDWSGINHLREK